MARLAKRFGILALAAVGLGWAGLGEAKPGGAKGKTEVLLQVKPVTSQLYIDDKPQGKASAGRVVEVTPGFHVVRLVNKGDEHEERVKFAPNQRTTYTFEFDEGQPTGGPETQPSEAPAPDDEGMTRHRNEGGDEK